MANPKPFVQAACVCETAILEVEGAMSLIRIVDTFHVQLPQVVPEGVKFAHTLTVVIMLKSGDITGEYDIAIALHEPDGKAKTIKEWPVKFEGGVHGVNVRLKFDLIDPKLGPYRFDVIWQGEVLTSIPFRLVKATASTQQPTQS